jgi:hypothetical protein
MKGITTNCSKYGQQEISVAYEQEKVLESDVKWLLEWLESEVTNGRRFLPSETIQIGWMLTKLEPFGDGILKIYEPDMKSFPVKFVDSVTHTLTHLRFQKMVAESIGVADELSFPPLNHSAVTCNRFREHVGIFMDRLKPKDSDSGWFIGCDDPNHDHQDRNNLRRKSLYELVVRHEQSIISYLALPAGISVHIRDGVPSFRRGEKQLAILPNSFLAASHSRK